MTMRRLLSAVAGFAVIVAGAVGLAAGVATPIAAAAATPPSVTAMVAPLPSDTVMTHNAFLNSIACGAPGFCVAGGQYTSQSGTEGLIDTWTGGSWTAQKAPLPGDANPTNPGAIVVKVACGAAGSCVAYAGYTSTSPPFNRYALLSLSSGTWTATDFPTLAGTAPTPTGVACNAANSCTVVGNYTGTDFLGRGFIAFFHTTWSVSDAPLPGDAIDPTSAFGGLSQLNAVSCSSTLCLGVGEYQKSNMLNEVLVEAITPSTPTANAQSKPTLPADDDHGTNLKGVSCESSGPCAAFGSYMDASNITHSLIVSLGSNWVNNWAPEQAPILGNDILTGTNPILSAIACAHGTSSDVCVLAGNYSNSGNSPEPLSDRLSGGTWTADTPPSSRFMATAGCGSPTFCVEADVVNSGITDELAVLSGTTWFAASAPFPGAPGTYLQLEATACDAATSCFAVGVHPGGGDSVIEHITATAAPPSVKLTAPPAPFTLASSTNVSWKGTAGGAAISRYTVQGKKAAWNGNFGAWSTPAAWANLSAATTHVSAALSVGVDSCYRVEAFDTAGHSAFSNQYCTAMPLDDKSLTASSGWTRKTSSSYYRGTYTTTTHQGAKLTRTGAEFERVALVATECSTCGKVGIYSGSTQLGTVNLLHSTTVRKVIFTLPAVNYRTATITIKVLSSGKTVQIDGLGISRS
jgi:hypothetical protein